jgi:hypothetical protein
VTSSVNLRIPVEDRWPDSWLTFAKPCAVEFKPHILRTNGLVSSSTRMSSLSRCYSLFKLYKSATFFPLLVLETLKISHALLRCVFVRFCASVMVYRGCRCSTSPLQRYEKSWRTPSRSQRRGKHLNCRCSSCICTAWLVKASKQMK